MKSAMSGATALRRGVPARRLPCAERASAAEAKAAKLAARPRVASGAERSDASIAAAGRSCKAQVCALRAYCAQREGSEAAGEAATKRGG